MWQNKDKTIGIDTDVIESYEWTFGSNLFLGDKLIKKYPDYIIINHKLIIEGEDALNLFCILKDKFVES